MLKALGIEPQGQPVVRQKNCFSNPSIRIVAFGRTLPVAPTFGYPVKQPSTIAGGFCFSIKARHHDESDVSGHFGDMFRRLESKGYRGAYTNAFGSLEDMNAARHLMLEQARAAGVVVA